MVNFRLQTFFFLSRMLNFQSDHHDMKVAKLSTSTRPDLQGCFECYFEFVGHLFKLNSSSDIITKSIQDNRVYYKYRPNKTGDV